MPKNVNVLVIRTAGTNCNEETAFAFRHFGAQVTQAHIKDVVQGHTKLSQYHILALPGGFSYGDDIASGRILANEIRLKLGVDIKRFIHDGKLVLGICNGFQILVKAGILPGLGIIGGNPSPASNQIVSGSGLTNGQGHWQEATLFHNDSAKFEARWVHLHSQGRSVWTKGVSTRIYLPVAHGEGKFIPRDAKLLATIEENNQVVFRYTAPDGEKPGYPDNPNGSTADIAGICDPTGRVLGLMPHPERHFWFEQHPSWTRQTKKSPYGDGAKIFENGINYVKDKLL